MTVKFKLYRWLQSQRFSSDCVYSHPPCFQTNEARAKLGSNVERHWLKECSSPHVRNPDVDRRSIPIEADDWIVIAEDVMGRLYNLGEDPCPKNRPPPPRECLRTDYMYEGFIEPIIRAFQTHSQLYAYVVAFDKPWFMPPEKTKVQKDRSKDNIPYPDHCRMVDEGLDVSPDPSSPCIEPLNLRRLLLDRDKRQRFYQYLLKRAMADDRLVGCRIILDFDQAGPWVLALGEARQHHELANFIGEGDLAVFHWILQFSDRCHGFISSIDHDISLIALMLFLFHGHRFKYSLHVQHNRHETLNVRELVEQFQKEGLPLYAFVAAVAICGTDYCTKSDLAHQYNDEELVDCILDFWKRSTRLAKREGTAGPDLHRDETCTNMLRWIRKIASTKCTERTSSQLSRGLAALRFNCDYWATLDGTLPVAGIEFASSHVRKRQRRQLDDMLIDSTPRPLSSRTNKRRLQELDDLASPSRTDKNGSEPKRHRTLIENYARA